MLSPAPVTFKANTPSGPLHALSGMSVLALQGRDAAAFLQAQLMNDVAALAVGQWQWNGWLSPKGRVIALFALLRTGEEEFLLVSPDFPAAELQARLQRYVFRSKLTLGLRSHLHAAAEFPAPGESSGSAVDRVSGDGPSGYCLDMGGAGGPRRLWLLEAGDPRLAAPEANADLRWLQQDLAHGLPRLGAGQSEAWTPQMLSLERLHAFSLKKGCYPGQEIVARTHYLGKAKRGLVRLRGAGLEPGQAVLGENGEELGQVVSTGGDESLAVLNLERAVSSLHANGSSLESLPLLDGLQRPL